MIRMDNEEMPDMPEDLIKSFKESVEIANDLSELAVDTLMRLTKVAFKHEKKEKMSEGTYHTYFIAFLQVLLTEYMSTISKIRLEKFFGSS